jgi:hypothetical protein
MVGHEQHSELPPAPQYKSAMFPDESHRFVFTVIYALLVPDFTPEPL